MSSETRSETGSGSSGLRGARRSLLRWGVLVLALAACFWNLRDLDRHWADAIADPSPGAQLLLWLRVGVGAVQASLLFLLVVRGRVAPVSSGRLRALLIYLPASAVVAASLTRAALAAGPEAQVSRAVFFVVLLSGSAWLVAQRSLSDARPPHRLELLAFNAVAVVVAAELLLAVWARLQPSPLLFAATVEARLAASRPEAHEPYLGTRLNAGGYHDGPFFAAGPDDLVVAVIADSFGMGVVPYAENFVTVAEAELRERLGERHRRVALHNFGVPAIGLGEYAHLLENEVLGLRPERVVLCVFVGNDVTSDRGFGAPGPGRFAFQDWLVVQLPRRLLARARAPAYVDALEKAPAPSGAVEAPPALSPDAYLALEARRLDVTDATDRYVEKRYRRFFQGLDYFHERLGERLLLVVFPDEFQVDDALWQAALARQAEPEAHVRDLPQQRIADWARARGVRLLDTSPALRAARETGSVYAPRNTHFDARGNRVVAALLASAIEASLRGTEPDPP